MNRVIDPREREKSHAEVEQVDFYAQALKASEQFRDEYRGRLNVMKASQMPLERSPDGLIKHIINEQMDTKECCLDLYQQFIPPGKATGKQDAAYNAMAEIMALAYHRLAAVNAIIVRPCATYGLSRGMWDTSAAGWNLLAAIIEDEGVGRNLSLRPTELVYAKDLAFAIREALFVEKPTSRVYNVGTGEIVSAADVAAAVAAAIPDARITSEELPGGPPRLLDTTLARRDLGYAPRWPLSMGVADMVAELQPRPSLK